MLAWYFARENNRLNHGDDRLIEIGKMHTVKHKPVLCKKGLHGSVNVLDALKYAPGSMLYRVDITRNVQIGDDKICGQRRKYLNGFNVTDVLRQFARNQALINIEKIKPYCSDSQYELIIEWLNTGNPELRVVAQGAAYAVVQSTAQSTVQFVARAVVQSTAQSTVQSTVLFVARSTALSTTRAAALSAILPDARSTANEMLTEMVEAAMLKIA